MGRGCTNIYEHVAQVKRTVAQDYQYSVVDLCICESVIGDILDFISSKAILKA
jgi:hypothetical protein